MTLCVKHKEQYQRHSTPQRSETGDIHHINQKLQTISINWSLHNCDLILFSLAVLDALVLMFSQWDFILLVWFSSVTSLINSMWPLTGSSGLTCGSDCVCVVRFKIWPSSCPLFLNFLSVWLDKHHTLSSSADQLPV